MKGFEEFHSYFINTISDLFHNTKIFMLQGTNIYNLTYELRENDCRLRCKLYDLFVLPISDKEKMNIVSSAWEKTIKKYKV
jgi:hypothetical protein